MKILIVGPSWVGDMVMAQTLFICLQQRYDNCQIDVLAPDWCRELLDRMPEVSKALAMPLQHGELAIGKRRQLGRQLREQGYDQAIVLPNSFKSALVPWFAGIARRTGWRGEARGWILNDCRTLDKQAYPLMVQRFAALAWTAQQALPDSLPYPALSARKELQPALLQRLGLDLQRPVVALCPGAEFGPAKQWPPAHFARLASMMIEKGWQVWLFGSANDRQVAADIISRADEEARSGISNLCGMTTLGEAVDLLAISSLVVSNDSGLMHIAAALARPVVVLYGSTSAAFTPPLATRVKKLALDLPCSPCFKRECPLQHLDCLNKLAPEQVLAEAMTLVN